MQYVLQTVALLVAGWVAGAESASWALVHPVIKRLPPDYQILFQQGLLKTFGRVMPVLMTANFALAIALWRMSSSAASLSQSLRLTAMLILGSMLLTTILFNVPVNIATGSWDAEDLPADWRAKRNRWRFFQGYRSLALVVAFLLLLVAQTVQ